MAITQFNITELYKELNPQNLSRKMQDSFNVDAGAINEAQRKNLLVIMATNKTIADGAQAVLQKQAVMFQTALQEVSKVAQSMNGENSVEELAVKQTELMKASYQTALKNTAEISELAKQTQEEVSAKVKARFAESLEELKDNMSKIS